MDGSVNVNGCKRCRWNCLEVEHLEKELKDGQVVASVLTQQISAVHR